MLLTFTDEAAHAYALRKLDEFGQRPAWIALMILGFIVWWPIGLAILAFMIGSGRMGCWSTERWQRKMQRMEDKMSRVRDRMECVGRGTWWRARAVERQPRLRRVPRRDAAPARGGAARVPRLPRPAAHRQGQGRVRPVHGRPAQPAPAARARDLAAGLKPSRHERQFGPSPSGRAARFALRARPVPAFGQIDAVPGFWR